MLLLLILYLCNILSTIFPCIGGGKWGVRVVKITAWGVEGKWKEASGYYPGGRSAKSPMEFHSVAKVVLASSLAFCFTFSTPITHFLSSHTSRSFIGTKQDPLKSFQKSMQTWECRARAQELMWPREEKVAGTVLRVSEFRSHQDLWSLWMTMQRRRGRNSVWNH